MATAATERAAAAGARAVQAEAGLEAASPPQDGSTPFDLLSDRGS
ncbi:hypothetical protein [Thermocatellispora tengchongensis]